MKMEFEGTRQRGRPRKTWWDCVKADMENFGLSREDAQDRDYWRMRIKGGTGKPRFTWKVAVKTVYVCACQGSERQAFLTSLAQFCRSSVNEELCIAHKLLGEKFQV